VLVVSPFQVVDDVTPVYGHPLIIGQEFGRDRWSIICQLDHKGRLLVLQEVEGTDISLQPHLNRSSGRRSSSSRSSASPASLPATLPGGRRTASLK
jgi:hypothetical protein